MIKSSSQIKTIKVSVIIPTYKDDERLNKCIEALNKQTYPKELFEVIVVNNDINSEINIFVEHSLNLKIFKEAKPGSYAARNFGIKHAEGEILAFTDSDCIPHIDWLDRGVDKMSNFPQDKIIVEGKVQLFYRNQNKLSFAECYEKIFGFSHQRIDKAEVPVMVTANGFVYSKAFDELGLFNSGLMSGGDSEFSLRAIEKKYEVLFNSESIVYHPARYSLNELVRKKKRMFGGKVYKSIYAENQSKLKSIASVLKKQIKRYFREIIQVINEKNESVKVKMKIIISIFYILMAVIMESIRIIFSNKTKR